MISTKKTRIATLLLVLVTLFTALFIPINAAEPDTSEDVGVEEIAPRVANSCGSPKYYQIDLKTNKCTEITFDQAIALLLDDKSVWVADEETASNLADAVYNEGGYYYYYDWDAPHTSPNYPYQYEHYQSGNGGHICFGFLLT